MHRILQDDRCMQTWEIQSSLHVRSQYRIIMLISSVIIIEQECHIVDKTLQVNLFCTSISFLYIVLKSMFHSCSLFRLIHFAIILVYFSFLFFFIHCLNSFLPPLQWLPYPLVNLLFCICICYLQIYVKH